MERSNENSINLTRPPLNQGILMDGVTRYSIETRNANRKAFGDIENLISGPTQAAPIGKRPLQDFSLWGEIADLNSNHGVSLGQGPMIRNFAAAVESSNYLTPKHNMSFSCMAHEMEISKGREIEMEDTIESEDKNEGGGGEEDDDEEEEEEEEEEEDDDDDDDEEEEEDDEDVEEEELIPDIDMQDVDNPLAVVEYVEEIFDSYRRSEGMSCVNPYMSNQTDINERMRAVMINWLIEVHCKHELREETLFLAVNLIDRFLSLQNVMRRKLQLVGVTALLLACKYEEVTVPVVEDLIVICDRAYTRTELLDMERLMVNTLQFKMAVPTPYVFMKRFLKAAQSDEKMELLSFFLVELCLVEYKMLRFNPSQLAAAAVFTAQCTLHGLQWWSKCCELHTRYTQDQLMECSRLIVKLHQKAEQGNLTSVHRKFGSPKYGCASKCEPALFLLGIEDDF